MHKNAYGFGMVEFIAQFCLSFSNGDREGVNRSFLLHSVMNFCFQMEVPVHLTRHP
jgi:hypothetical protein